MAGLRPSVTAATGVVRAIYWRFWDATPFYSVNPATPRRCSSDSATETPMGKGGPSASGVGWGEGELGEVWVRELSQLVATAAAMWVVVAMNTVAVDMLASVVAGWEPTRARHAPDSRTQRGISLNALLGHSNAWLHEALCPGPRVLLCRQQTGRHLPKLLEFMA